MREAGRLPPGQSLTLKWPVLHAGDVPRFDPETWDFRIAGLVNRPLRLSWAEFSHLPMIELTSDMHCVTRWSRFDVRWEGVPFGEVAKIAKANPEAKYVMVEAEYGYRSNVPLVDLMRPTTLFALKHGGQPLAADHGYPVRLVVPHLYAWKSVKWVRGLEFMRDDAPGFWEQNGYHIYGDPFQEQRFSPRVSLSGEAKLGGASATRMRDHRGGLPQGCHPGWEANAAVWRCRPPGSDSNRSGRGAPRIDFPAYMPS